MSDQSNDVIRQGYVSSINYEEGCVRVVYPDKNNAVTAELPLQSFEYDMPRVGDQVYIMHQSNGVEKGLVLSRYWHDNEVPPEYGWHIWRKDLRDYPTFPEGSYFKFDRESHTLTIRVVGSPDLSINIITDKDIHVTTGGNAVIDATDNVEVNAAKNVSITALENVGIKAAKTIVIDAAVNVNVKAADEATINTGKSASVTAGESITLTANDINLEGGTHIGLHAGVVEANGKVIG